MSLEHSLERTVLIAAERSTVFRFFTDLARFAAWWGAGSRIEPRPGGAVHILHPGGVVSSGEVVEIEPDRRIVFTYGFESGQPIPPGSSLVTITLAQEPLGTRLHLRHELPSASARDEHVQGWRYQLALFANVAAADQHTDLDARVDAFFEAWAEPDPVARRGTAGRASPPTRSSSATASPARRASTTWPRTSAPRRSTCPASASIATAPSASAKARPSSTGRPRAPTAPCAGAGSTCSSWPRTGDSRP